jgi:hypothetical protein
MRSSYYTNKKPAFYKSKKVQTIFVGIFMIVLMALSTISIGFGGDDAEESTEKEVKVQAKGLNFLSSSQGYVASTKSGSAIILQYDPSTLSEMEYLDFSIFKLPSKVYVSFNPNDQYALYALYSIERNILMNALSYACYEDFEGCQDMPLRTCDDATDSVSVIVLNDGGEDGFSYENNCLTITGENLLRVVDSMLLEYYGTG